MLDEQPDNEAYHDALKQLLWQPYYTPDIREQALNRLERHDPEGLHRTLRQRVPNLNAFEWLDRVCMIIAERGWAQHTPTLVSSWSRPAMGVDEKDRPEYRALAELHGADRVTDVVFETFLEADKPYQQGLRARCWELLHRLDQRERLIALLEDAQAKPDDLMLMDLRAGARDFGIVPLNREEILWLRKLRQPEHEAFWNETMQAMQQVPEQRRHDLELRDLAIVVAAYRHEPELLTAGAAELQRRIEARVQGRSHYSHTGNFDNQAVGRRDRLHEWRGELTWGDLAAMHLLLKSLAVPEVRAHLMDYAERDRQDETTEYGGVINLDEQGRFQVLEFIPRVRHHDQKFMASQDLFDAAYTALFHFHFHCQSWRNRAYAGPGFGDVNYAENTRANCVVLTCVSGDELNVDFYRYGRVSVDLGTIGSADNAN